MRRHSKAVPRLVKRWNRPGRLLEDPEGLLEGGNLKKGRFLRLRPGAAFPEQSIALLVAEAIAVRA